MNNNAPSPLSQTSIARVTGLSKHHVIASMISIVIVSLAVWVLYLGSGFTQRFDKTVTVRELSVSPPAPPPPPPIVQQQAPQTPISLQVEGAGPSIKMIELKQKVTLEKPDIPTLTVEKTQWQSLEIDWDAVNLDALDGIPTLLTQLRVKVPKSLSRQGLKRVLVKLDVLIDEQGHVSLIDIVSNPHPQLESEIKRLVKNTRFSPPQKDSQPARARFIWPVEIEL